MTARFLPPIVTGEEIAGRTDIVFCDVRWYLDRTPGRNKYNEGHIPGSIFVDLDEHLATLPRKSEGRHPIPAAASFAASLGSLGVSHEDPVVAYDDSGGMSAGRLVWMLRVLGHDAALLDGGLQGWTGDLETVPQVRDAVDHPIREWPPELFVDADAAAMAGDDPAQVLIDARSPDRFAGENEPVDPKAGHIPGAINLPFTQNLSPDSFFESPEQLRQRFENAGCTAGPATVMYCGSGVSACNNLLAFEHAGLGKARLYAGSWSQWSNSEDRPVETS
tara:strand:+ start:587 stop:1417 length:831 start_codon:yes stop_codon:yes gene_type:complete